MLDIDLLKRESGELGLPARSILRLRGIVASDWVITAIYRGMMYSLMQNGTLSVGPRRWKVGGYAQSSC